MTRPFKVTGATAVITAGGSGIGRAIALELAARGARVAVSDLDEARAIEVADAVAAEGGDAIGLAADVTDEQALVRLRDATLQRFGAVDIVVNNAGVLAMGAPEQLPDEAWLRTLDVNVLSIARTDRVFLPLLLDRGRGHVVNTASASGLLAYGYDRLPYVASKHAIVGISEALAIYLGPKGIGVTVLCPSGVITNILEQITVYGEATSTPRAPAHDIVSAETVGRLAVDAIEQGRFLVTTVPDVQSELLTRATDIEAYLQARIEEQDT